jgi:vancomycin resistance protein YoaR
MGFDATLSFPEPDLVFRNDTEAGLLIKTVAAKYFKKSNRTVGILKKDGGV